MRTVDGRLADGRRVAVAHEGGRIVSVTPRSGGGGPDRLILPGLVDLQVNGYAGIDVNAEDPGPGDVDALVRALWKRGVTTLLPTVVTAPEERITAALRAVAGARADGPAAVRSTLAGAHVEGPYLSPEDGPRGAHDPRHLRDPDPAEFARWQRAAGGLVRIVTLAPERPGALGCIEELARQGVVVAVGHTAADPELIAAAAEAGARLSTHLGNGAHARLPRHPNHLWAQLAEDRLTASFIADGHHLPADTLTVMLRAKGPERAVLVSDSAALAGCPPGDYTTPVGGRVTVGADGRLTLTGSPLLAGSGRSLADCLGWAHTALGLDLPALARLAAANPARLLGLRDRGVVEPGARADLLLAEQRADGGLDVQATLVGGEVVHEA